MKQRTWQKPARWWAPWRRRALRREWNRQVAIVHAYNREHGLPHDVSLDKLSRAFGIQP